MSIIKIEIFLFNCEILEFVDTKKDRKDETKECMQIVFFERCDINSLQ